MQIIALKKIEDCLSGRNVWDLYLNNIIDADFIKKIENLGNFIMHQFKPKPFFKLIVRSQYTIKGSIGNRTVRLILPDDATISERDNIIAILNEKLS